MRVLQRTRSQRRDDQIKDYFQGVLIAVGVLHRHERVDGHGQLPSLPLTFPLPLPLTLSLSLSAKCTLFSLSHIMYLTPVTSLLHLMTFLYCNLF